MRTANIIFAGFVALIIGAAIGQIHAQNVLGQLADDARRVAEGVAQDAVAAGEAQAQRLVPQAQQSQTPDPLVETPVVAQQPLRLIDWLMIGGLGLLIALVVYIMLRGPPGQDDDGMTDRQSARIRALMVWFVGAFLIGTAAQYLEGRVVWLAEELNQLHRIAQGTSVFVVATMLLFSLWDHKVIPMWSWMELITGQPDPGRPGDWVAPEPLMRAVLIGGQFYILGKLINMMGLSTGV